MYTDAIRKCTYTVSFGYTHVHLYIYADLYIDTYICFASMFIYMDFIPLCASVPIPFIACLNLFILMIYLCRHP